MSDAMIELFIVLLMEIPPKRLSYILARMLNELKRRRKPFRQRPS